MIIFLSRIFQDPEYDCTTSYSQSFMISVGSCLGSFLGRTLYRLVRDLEQNPGHDSCG